MAGKLVECAENEAPEFDGVQPVTPQSPHAVARALNVMLSGTVLVDYDVTVTEVNGSTRNLVVRIEFPDEVRSMLEASTWGRGLTILEALSRLGAGFVEQNAASGLFRFTRWDPADALSLRPPTFHIPLSYVRSSLAIVCSAAV